ncbi:MAG: GntR family transcriptional regulator [Nitrospiraceae bacterium]|nr:GntR family transcriptional regulator [Nitrospiraceae bacterium]
MTVKIDRLSPVPLWAQIVDDLRRRLLSGEFENGFPTDEQLTKEYDVGRQTAREAVRRLSAEGVVIRQRGRRTSVSAPILEQPIHSFYSLASTMRALGMEERNEVLAAERQPADMEVAEQLEVKEGDEVVYVERLRFAGDEPIAWDRSWLPAEKAAAVLEADLRSQGLYALLSVHCGVHISGGRERIIPVVPDATERKLLRLSPGIALFSVERLVMGGEDPIEWRKSLIRGDRYALVAHWASGVQAGAEEPG